MLRRAGAVGDRRPKPDFKRGGFRLLWGVGFLTLGILLGGTAAVPTYNTLTQGSSRFFDPLYGAFGGVHTLLMSLLMVVGGAWLAITGARDSGLWRPRG
jgi:hypothetical protein